MIPDATKAEFRWPDIIKVQIISPPDPFSFPMILKFHKV